MHISLSKILLPIGLFASFVAGKSTTVHVCSSCDYTNITSALDALPNTTETWTVAIAPGTYTEQIILTRNNTILKPSSSKGTVALQYSAYHDTQAKVGHDKDSAVLAVRGGNIKVYDISIANIYPQTVNLASLALSVEGYGSSFYGVKLYGFQDTLYIFQDSSSYFKNCHIEGSVDFIFGPGSAYFDGCDIASNKPGGYITASKRQSATADGGFYFNNCNTYATIPTGPLTAIRNSSLTFTSSSQFPDSCYLGRPWNQYARVVFMNSKIGSHINPAGWSIWKNTDPRTSNVTFQEFNDSGSNPWNETARANFSSSITASQAKKYTLKKVFNHYSWIDLTYK